MTYATGGVLIIDKPGDVSSAKAVARVKRLTGARKVGHAGTLDPFATGVLVCCLNQATKLSGFFMRSDKTYEITVRLGVETDTQDVTGAVIDNGRLGTDDELPGEARVRAALKNFTGRIRQQPPSYSALKHKGTPLYKLARRGTPVRKPARPVHIASIRVLGYRPPDLELEVTCSAGAYMRTLAADLGAALGCGAHARRLRRTQSGKFSLKDAVCLTDLEALTDAGRLADAVLDMTAALDWMPAHYADADLAAAVQNGRPMTTDAVPPPAGSAEAEFLKITDADGRLLAVLSRQKNSRYYNYCCVFKNNP